MLVVVAIRSVQAAVGDRLMMVKESYDFVVAVSAPLEDCFVDPEFLPGFGEQEWD